MRHRFQRRLAAVGMSLAIAGLGIAALPALPTLVPGPVNVVAHSIPIALTTQQVVALPSAATDVALHWQGNADASVTIAFQDDSGAWSDPVVVDRDEAGESVSSTETYGDVMWADGSRAVRVTADRPIAHLVVLVFQADGPATPVVASGPVVAAAVGQPSVVTRAGWGANESLRFDPAGHELWPPSYWPLQKIFVHHTDGRNNDPNPAATVRSIYYYQAVTEGWGDIGYNFLIDASGHIYEGRHARAYASGEVPTSEDLAGNGVRGAQAKGFNEGTFGIAMLGTFDTVLPTVAARNALESLLAWILQRHGISPTGTSLYTNPVLGTQKTLPNIGGHRDVNQTDCPGATLYAYLPTIRAAVASRIAAATGPTVDKTAPTVRSITPMVTNPTGASTIGFGVIFSEPVTGLTAADFQLSGTSPGWAISGLSGRGSTYTLTAKATTPTEGSVILSLPTGTVADLSGNAGPAAAASATAHFAVDTTAPTVSLYGSATPNAPAGTSWNVTVTFSEPVVGLATSAVKIAGTSNAATPWTIDPLVGSGAHYGFSIHNDHPASGTLTLAIPAGATTDPAANPNLASAVLTLYYDRTPPRATAPLVRLRASVQLGSSVPVTIAWTATDAGGSGLRSYDLARSTDGGAFKAIYIGLLTPVASISLVPGHAYRFEARARDRAGNVGAWTAGATVNASVVQQTSTSILHSGTWSTATGTGFSGGSTAYATAHGASASLRTTARSLAFVTTLAAGRGIVRIYVDGLLRTSIDLGSSTTVYRRVAYAASWSSVGTHTLKVIVVGTPGRPRVDLDAFTVLR